MYSTAQQAIFLNDNVDIDVSYGPPFVVRIRDEGIYMTFHVREDNRSAIRKLAAALEKAASDQENFSE